MVLKLAQRQRTKEIFTRTVARDCSLRKSTRREFLALATVGIGAPLRFACIPLPSAVRNLPLKERMKMLLGPAPSTWLPLDPSKTTRGKEVIDGDVIRQCVTFNSPDEQGTPIQAYLMRPTVLQKSAPAVLCLHQTDCQKHGKEEAAGVFKEGDQQCPALKPHPYDSSVMYAKKLAQRGYITLAPGYYADLTDTDYYPLKHAYSGYFRLNIRHLVRCVDFLENEKLVAKDRVGCVGHSAGGTHALYLSVFDKRIRVIVSCSGFGTFETYLDATWVQTAGGSGLRTYMPIIDQFYKENKCLPFEFEEMLPALAPRPLFLSIPLRPQAPPTPRPAKLPDPSDNDRFVYEVLMKSVDYAKHRYEHLGAGKCIEVLTTEYHEFPTNPVYPSDPAYNFLDKWLHRAAPATT